jgi:hypothetical protein
MNQSKYSSKYDPKKNTIQVKSTVPRTQAPVDSPITPKDHAPVPADKKGLNGSGAAQGHGAPVNHDKSEDVTAENEEGHEMKNTTRHAEGQPELMKS